MNYILIDGSYYCFYRYYAIHAWFRNAHKEVNLENPFENELFVEKFKKMFINPSTPRQSSGPGRASRRLLSPR